MQRLSLLAAGAAAMTSVTLLNDDDVKMEVEYYVDGDNLHFITNQQVKINAEITMASQKLMVTESLTSVMIEALTSQGDSFGDEEGMPFKFLDGFMGIYSPPVGMNLLQGLCALEGDAEPTIDASCPWKQDMKTSEYSTYSTDKIWTVGAKRNMKEFYELKEGLPYSILASYALEDMIGREYESQEPKVVEILLGDSPDGALVGFAASALAIVAALIF